MASSFDMISNVSPAKDSWRLKVRVIRLWEMCSILDPLKPFAIDMVLIDVEGGMIQAIIRKPMMRKFKNVIVEGEVYTMINFGVIKSVGNYCATKHEYKLLFSGKTRVFPVQSELIPAYGLSLMNTKEVGKTNGESNFLIDLIGLLTVVSAEKELITEGRKTRMVQMELTDDKLAISGIDPNVVMVDLVVGTPLILLADDFLKMYPRKTPEQLQLTEEEGIFIVLTIIISVSTKEQWWYGSCKCHKAVTPDGGLYYCSNCCTHVVEVTPKYKVKVEVCHWDETAVSVLFYSDVAHLLGKSCKEMISETKEVKSGDYPPDFIRLIGKAFLFKVEKGPEYAFSYHDSFKVKKVCDDPDIITKFKDRWGIVTPRKLKFEPPSPLWLMVIMLKMHVIQHQMNLRSWLRPVSPQTQMLRVPQA